MIINKHVIAKHVIAYYIGIFIAVTIEDVLDDDVEAERVRIKERCLPIDSPILFSCMSGDVCETKMLHPVGGTGEG